MHLDRFRAAGRALLTTLAVAALAAATGAAQGAHEAVPAHARLTLRSSDYGKVIFDSRGRVIYVFSADRGSRSNCYSAWLCSACRSP
jgi:predicted lipoprotein with Yx(FWY)xxD motif